MDLPTITRGGQPDRSRIHAAMRRRMGELARERARIRMATA
jgi:hypothetical protein